MALSGLLMSSAMTASAEQAVPDLPSAATDFGTGARLPEVVGNKMSIQQTAPKAVLNWNSFDIGQQHHVDFIQNVSDVALNRIANSIRPSEIHGKLSAGGSVYLINPNGFIFGKDSVVNVNSLIASTHDITDEVLELGIANVFTEDGRTDPAFILDSSAFEENTNKLKQILVEHGARITAGDSGNVIIVAPKVTNEGDIESGEFGQIMLVASQDKVYLQEQPTTPGQVSDFKGMLVEVETGGEVNNFGNILAKQGDITLAGFVVNQSGQVNATTSVTVNGSVRLQAREGQGKIGKKLVGTRTLRTADQNDGLGLQATVNLKPGQISTEVENAQGAKETRVIDTRSLTTVTADEARGTDNEGQDQPASYVEISGHTITMQQASRVVVPAGKVVISASEVTPVENSSQAGSGRFVMEQGSVLDVAGYKDVEVAMARNVGVVDARSSFVFRDSPNQKEGELFGKDLTVDLRKTTDFIDIQGPKDAVQASVFERLSAGGEISLTSSGEVAVHEGALINIAGGSVKYLDGEITTSILTNINGQQVDISDADPLDVYVGFEDVSYTEKGYTQGNDAGSLSISTAQLDWQGELDGSVMQGINQRNQSDQARGGKLEINLAGFQSAQNLVFQGANALAKLALSGIQDFSLNTLGEVSFEQDARLEFNPFSTIDIQATTIRHEGQLYSAGGSIKFTGKRFGGQDNGHILLGENAQLDVSGRWINDQQSRLSGVAQPAETLVIDGGRVDLLAEGNLQTTKGSSIRADGGVHYLGDENVVAGTGGNINLVASYDGDGSSSVAGRLKLDGNISATGLKQNGSIALVSPESWTIDSNFFADTFSMDSALFSSISLESRSGEIRLTSQTHLDLTQTNRQLSFGFQNQQSQRNINGLSELTTRPRFERATSDLQLQALSDVILETGSSIKTEAQSTISMTSRFSSVFVDGTIDSPAGTINVTADNQASRFDPAQSVWLGEHAQINVAGISLLEPFIHERRGDVLDGGSINLQANRGYVVIEQGARLDVSGTSDIFDIATQGSQALGLEPVRIGSNGGEINLTAAEGMLLEGTMLAQGGTARNFDGRLSIELSRANLNLPTLASRAKEFPVNSLVIDVSQSNASPMSGPLAFGDGLGEHLDGQAFVYADQITAAGFDVVDLTSNNTSRSNQLYEGTVRFTDDVQLNAGVAIHIDAPIIEGVSSGDGSSTAQLNAQYIRMGSGVNQTVNGASVAGENILSVNAQWMELFGALKLNSFKQVNLTSQNEMQLVANHEHRENDFGGELVTTADLNLTAGKIYPSTFSRYRFKVENEVDGTINVFASGGNDSKPLSAGGQLIMQAAHINQQGNLFAPLGVIDLQASKSIRLGDGGITSVSADGLLIPVGNVVDGLDWLYPLAIGGDPAQSVSNLVLEETENARLDKQLILDAPAIVVAENAVIDQTGGGDVFGYEFIAGKGGSFDYLQPGSGSYQNSFAVLPELGTTYAPFDFLQSQRLGKVRYYAPGETVVLNDAANGLAAGEYAKLPAHYALLPGAYLVTPVSGTQDQILTEATVDNTPIVSGFSQIAGTGKREARSSGFMIENGTQIRKKSEYNTYTGDQFFAEKAATNETPVPLLARDGGLISMLAQTRLLLEGEFRIDAPEGISARMDIAADNIRVTEQLSETPEEGVLEIRGQDLTDLNLAGLLLGGQRKTGTAVGETIVEVSSENISFEQGAHLDVADLIVAAKDTVRVKDGATVAASTETSSGDQLLTVSGDGALLRVSGAEQVNISRSDASGQKGVLVVEQGATLHAQQSMLLDSSVATDISGKISMQGGSLNLATNSINIGELNGQANNDALNLSNALLDEMSVDELVLTSREAIHFYGTVASLDAHGVFEHVAGGGLSSHNIERLAFNAAGLVAHNTSGVANPADSVNLSVDTLILQNTLNQVNTLPATGSGTLNIAAREIVTGEGQFIIDGFNTVNLSAEQQFNAQGIGALQVKADVNLATARMTAGSLGDYTLDASGHQIRFTQAGVKNPARASGVTGELAVNAAQITLDTEVDLASGAFDLHATEGDVVLAENAYVNLSGQERVFADITVASRGGDFSVTADHGAVRLAAGSDVNLDGGNERAQGGQLTVNAEQDNLFLNGDLSARNGAIDVNVKGTDKQADFDNFLDQMATAGFNKSIAYRSQQDLIHIAQGKEVKAEKVKFVADKGTISVAGVINADAAKDSEISLHAAKQLNVQGMLTARTQTDQQGGNVLLATKDTTGTGIRIEQGAQIEVGNQNNQLGSVILQAPRMDSNGDGVDDTLNVTQVAGTVNGFAGNGFYAEAVGVHHDTDGRLDATEISQVKQHAEALMTTANQLAVRTLHNKLNLRPLVEINSDQDLVIAAELNTVDWRYAPLDGDSEAEIGRLVIRSAGDLNVNEDITDGFKSGKLTQDNSWHFQLVAGADVPSADNSAVNHPGNIELGTNAHGVKVQTGTGDIDLHAGGDINFNHLDSNVLSLGRQNEESAYGSFNRPSRSSGVNAVEFPEQGGDVSISAQGNINNNFTQQEAESGQLINQWLHRQTISGRSKNKTSWGVIVEKPVFQQNIGSFGGGDVAIRADGDINNISAMLPTTGKNVSSNNNSNEVDILGGGDLTVQADGNIRGGAFYVARGDASIVAGQSITGGKQFADGPVIALGDSRLSLQAGDDVNITGVIDPMLLHNSVNFFSYTEESAFSVTSLAGNIDLGVADLGALNSYLGITSPGSGQQSLVSLYPASLDVMAMDGNIYTDNNIDLFPSRFGALNLLAKGSISPQDTTGSPVAISMSDGDPALLTTWKTPDSGAFSNDLAQLDAHKPTPLHINDSDPVRVVTLEGNIEALSLDLPKKAVVSAGKDLAKMTINIQNINPDDVSLVEAGRDLRSVSSRNPETGGRLPNGDSINVAGPGKLFVKTGRDIDLGRSAGITTDGNASNVALSAEGADITIIAGANQAIDFAGFLQKMNELSAENRGNAFFDAELRSNYDLYASGNKLFDLMAQVAEHHPDINERPLAQQIQLVMPLYYEVLLNASRQHNQDIDQEVADSIGTLVGNAAMDTLFPGENWQGDVDMFFSTIQSKAGGNIDIVVPGGGVNVGLATSSGEKEASELGIINQAGGHLNIAAQDNVDVNRSRIITIGGGHSMIVVQNGNIDGGTGAKSASAAAQIDVQVTDDGRIIMNFLPDISGSGIQNKEGITDLASFQGEIIANEAGILADFEFEPPVSDPGNLGSNDNNDSGSSDSTASAPVSLSNSTADTSKTAEKAVQNGSDEDEEKPIALGMLTVDVVSYDSVEDEDDEES